jgi:hypothetical protein
MFYMPGTKMLFGDAKDSCEGASSRFMSFDTRANPHFALNISYQEGPGDQRLSGWFGVVVHIRNGLESTRNLPELFFLLVVIYVSSMLYVDAPPPPGVGASAKKNLRL